MIEKIIILLNAAFDMFILFGLHYYVDEYCTNVKIIQYLLYALKILEPVFGKISCSLLLRPFQICTFFGYLSNMLSSKIPISFTLNLIIRLLVIMIMVLNPWLLLFTSKLLTLSNYLGCIILVYFATHLSWRPGLYFQTNLQYAIYTSIPLALTFIYLLFSNTKLLPRLAILLPIAQVIITDKGSLITSLILGIIMMMLQSILFSFILSCVLVGYVLFTQNTHYQYILVGLMVSNSLELPDNNVVSILFMIIYIVTLFYSRKEVTKVV